MPRDYRRTPREKDPWIDVVRTGFERAGKTIYQVAEDCNHTPSVTTIQNWLYGDTLRPQRYTMERVLASLGIEMKAFWTINDQIVRVSEAAKKVWVRKVRQRAAKRRKRDQG